MTFLVSVTWLNAYAMLAYGLSIVPGFSSEPSVETTSNSEESLMLSTNSAGPGVAVMVTDSSSAGEVKVAIAQLSLRTTASQSRVPAVALKSKLYSGI